MISNNSDNPRQLWNYINRTFHRKTSVSLPARDSTNSLDNSFYKHFKDNISDILSYCRFQVEASCLSCQFTNLLTNKLYR